MPEYDVYNSTINSAKTGHMLKAASISVLRHVHKHCEQTLKSEQHTWSLLLNDLGITLRTDRANQENTVSQKSKNWEDSNIYLDSLVAN